MATATQESFSFSPERLPFIPQVPALFLTNEGVIKKVNDSAEKAFKLSSSDLVDSSLDKHVTLKNAKLQDLLEPSQGKTKAKFTTLRGGKTYQGTLKIQSCSLEEVKFLALIENFHKTKKIEKKLEAVEDELARLQSLNERQIRCFRQTLHDVNNSLAEMITILQDIKEENPGMKEETPGIWEKILTLLRTLRFIRMVTHSVCNFEKLTAEQIVLNEVSFSPSKLLQKTVELFFQSAEREGINLSLDIPDINKLFSFLGDYEIIIRILYNLIGNAIKFTPAGGSVKVSMPIKRIKGKADYRMLEISVSDSGPGIPDEHLQTIFKPGVQVGEKKELGLGLGLSICSEFVKAMGGKISVKNNPDQGAQFTISLPLKRVCGSPMLPNSSDPVITFIDPNVHRKFNLRIAVADDNPSILRTIQRTLTRSGCGYDVHLATNGIELLKLLTEAQDANNPFDVVFTDLNMGRSAEGGAGENGDEATAEWRKLEERNHWKHTFFVGLTADDTASGRKQFKQSGVDKLLGKPVSPSEMLGLIDRKVIQPKLQEENSASASLPFRVKELHVPEE